MVLNAAERDILTFSGPADTQDWLVHHGLVAEDTVLCSIRVIDDWDRPGSESYLLHFAVDYTTEGVTETAEFVSKSCIKVPGTETMQEWLARRRQLDALGIETPKLYVAEGASLVEEYIPYSLKEAFDMATDEGKKRILEELARIYELLFSNGFWPRIMTDVRSRVDDAVVIDLGEDLGGASSEQREPYDISDVVTHTLGEKALVFLYG